jgi:hypothetical protein
MRRVYVVIGIWFAIAVLATVAFGDPVQVKVKEQTPPAIVAGEPYVVNLLVTRYGRRIHGAKPVITVRYAGGSFTYRATEKGHDGIYSARVRVPLPGRWDYEVRVNGKTVKRRTVKVLMPEG